ncbi:acyltransferase [Sphingobacterium sp. T2]|uniref:acyltransferase n=1 Tax=Sphingobacterium sp. T2 TaxID=1590596 RepID=UPI000AE3B557|nr:acyltransferase family protein [Sphingobacterium sp. T2]
MTPQNNAISYTRAVATVFVILIHASTGFLNRFHAEGFDWNFANWINAATRCSVPLFVMISGALLLSKEEETFSFYKKRLPKLCWPFVFWTVIYMIYYFYRYTHFSTLSSQKIIAIIQDKILHGANAHLWFMYMIIGMYLAIPFVKKIVRQASLREIELFLVLWAVAMFITNKFYYPYTLRLTYLSFRAILLSHPRLLPQHKRFQSKILVVSVRICSYLNFYGSDDLYVELARAPRLTHTGIIMCIFQIQP